MGLAAPLVTVEVHLSGGLPQFQIVGLPETAVRESRERVRGALVNSRFDFPASRITVNLAPADLPKHGGRFDLAIALGILAASGQMRDKQLANIESFAELTLSGELAPIAGVLPAALQSQAANRCVVIAKDNGTEALLINDLRVVTAESLADVVAILEEQTLPSITTSERVLKRHLPCRSALDQIRGQETAKRALAIAAVGGHHLLLVGPPGTGKSLLASALPSLLPPMSRDEALVCAGIRSLCDERVEPEHFTTRPFRSPHHSASAAALIGGGSRPRPGEISRAHNGVLFLDELPEFASRTLDMLREPMETGVVHLSRAAMQVTYPARFQMVAAMNPCSCGYAGDPERECRCSGDQVARYQSRVSGPLLDRIDLAVTVGRVKFSLLAKPPKHDTQFNDLIDGIAVARQRALDRQGCPNAALPGTDLLDCAGLSKDAERLLSRAADSLFLSARSCHRLIRVARTIADIFGEDRIAETHMAEALAYRR